MIRFRSIAIALILLISSNAWADLRVYDVDPQYRQEIYAALTNILAPQGMFVMGRVELLPSGQLLVNASAETLEQVGQVLQAISNRPAAPTPRVDLRYWAVLGTRAVVTNPPGGPPPSALGDVLGELKRLHGDLHFRVIGTAALTSDSGQRAAVDGMTLEVEQTAFVQGDTLNATIEMSLNGTPFSLPISQDNDQVRVFTTADPVHIGGVEVRTALRRGESVILGQSDRVGGGLDGQVFYIVHWPD
jgi:hypothetical protein